MHEPLIEVPARVYGLEELAIGKVPVARMDEAANEISEARALRAYVFDLGHDGG